MSRDATWVGDQWRLRISVYPSNWLLILHVCITVVHYVYFLHEM